MTNQIVVPILSLVASAAGILFIRRQMRKLRADERRDAELAEQFEKTMQRKA